MPLLKADSIVSKHAPGLGIAGALTLFPAVAEAVDPGALPGLGPDSPTWVTPLIMGLGLLLSKGFEMAREIYSRDRKDLEARVQVLEAANAKLTATLVSARDRELEDAKKIYQLEAEVEIVEAKVGHSATDLVSPLSSRDRE